MASTAHRRSLIWAAALAMLLAALTLSAGRASSSAGAPCLGYGVRESVTKGKTPILFVHGINSSYRTWASTQPPDGAPVTGTSESPLMYVVNSLGSGRVAGYTFDWSRYSGDKPGSTVMWLTGPPSLAASLAQAIHCVAGIAGRRVIIVAHSMGGLITEAASSLDSSDIAAVFTLGTPYQGSWLASTAVGQEPPGGFLLTLLTQALAVDCSINLGQPKAHYKSPPPAQAAPPPTASGPLAKQHGKPAGPIEQACRYVNERDDPGVAAMRLNGGPQGGWKNLHWPQHLPDRPAGLPVYPLAAAAQGVWQPVWPLSITEPLNDVGDGVVGPASQQAGGVNPPPVITCSVIQKGAPVPVTIVDAVLTPCFHVREPDNKDLLAQIVSIIKQQQLVPTIATQPSGAIPEFYVHNGYELGSLYKYPGFPVSIGLDNHDYISGLKWQQPAPGSATAMGTLNFDDCTPDCASGTYQASPVELLASDPQQCPVKVYKHHSAAYSVTQALVYNKIYVKSLGGNPPASLVGYTVYLPPACGGAPSSTGPVGQPGPAGLTITSATTYQKGVLVYFSLHYSDPNHIAQGFGFAGVKGSSWAEEQHPFTSPSYGIVGPDSIDYPFNLGCGTQQQYPSDVKAWIYGSGGVRSKPVVIHLACTGQAG